MIKTTDDRQLWDQAEGESASTYALFRTYRDMPPLSRSLRNLAEIDPEQRAVSTLHSYQHQHNWIARIKAFDDNVDEYRQQLNADLRRKEDEIHLTLCQRMADLAIESAKIIDPKDVGPQYLPRIADTAVKISHLITDRGATGLGSGVVPESVKTFEQIIAELNKEVSKA